MAWTPPDTTRKQFESFKRIKIDKTALIIVAIIIFGILLRTDFYGDLNLSVATDDTISYISSSRSPLFSIKMMTGQRLLTTNIIYKFFEPAEGFTIIVNGSANTTHRAAQPGFENIALLQYLVSIFSWGFLAHCITAYIKSHALKIAGAITILVFAFTPQIADWDSILMSESLTFSLFALQFACLSKITFKLHQDPAAKIAPYLIGFGIANFFWVFLRDTNLYAELVIIGLAAAALLSPKYRKINNIILAVIITAGIFLLGWITSGNSPRALTTISHVYSSDLLPFPSRVEYLRELGMPPPSESPEYQTWFRENAVNAFVRFMIAHPGYVISKFSRDFMWAFSENMQTYFRVPGQETQRQKMILLGDGLHPRSLTPFIVDIILLFGLFHHAISNVTEPGRPWAWLALWLFLTASFTIFFAIMGDVYGLARHTLFSIMAYRLFMWVFLIVLLDIGFDLGAQASPRRN